MTGYGQLGVNAKESQAKKSLILDWIRSQVGLVWPIRVKRPVRYPSKGKKNKMKMKKM